MAWVLFVFLKGIKVVISIKFVYYTIRNHIIGKIYEIIIVNQYNLIKNICQSL